MKDAVRDAATLCRLLHLPPHLATAGDAAAREFPLFVPRSYLSRIQPGDPGDPLLRQVLPVVAESEDVAGFLRDPVRDLEASRLPGLVRKYHGRALLIVSGACAVHCRYCFRRHFPYAESPRSLDAWTPALHAIEADESLTEVILSGGDPLMLADDRLAELATRLETIEHLRRLRVHTRLPVMIPERVTDRFLEWLGGGRLTPVLVVHVNHAAELDEQVSAAIARLIDAGIPVLNQAVLLRGVNDSADALAELCERLVDLRVVPYYLHQLDRVDGAAHFEVPTSVGRRLMEALRRRLPGYAVPRYVQEIPGHPHKEVLA